MPLVAATYSVTASPTTGSTSTPISFTSGSFNGQGTDIWASTDWDFGDGTTATGRNVTHTYTTAGSYYATANVTTTTGFSLTGGGANIDGSGINQPIVITAPTSVTVSLTSSGSPALSSASGGSVQLTATLTGFISGSTGGAISFFDGTTKLGEVPVDGSGVATLLVALAASGSHSLSASFNGDTLNSASTTAGTLTQVISAAYIAGADTSNSGGMSMTNRAIPTVYKHVQATASATWTIKHYLKGYPAIDVYVDTNGIKEKILADQVTYIDLDTCTVTFTTAFSGIAMVS